MPAPATLPDPRFLEEPRLKHLLAVLNPPSGAGETRVIGGAIRNALMALPIADVDCATILKPEEVVRRAEAARLHVVPTGVKFGTVTVLVKGAPFEVTTLRRDVATDGRWAEVALGTDWAEDAARRDFTMNALSCDPDGRLYDPLNGYDDVIARHVRFIGEARQRIREDYLRSLRFFRFHAQYGAGAPDAEGFRAVVAERAGIGRLSPERIRQEMLKLLVAPGAIGAVEALTETGILVDLLGVPALGRLMRLAAIEAANGLVPIGIRRLGALSLRIAEDAERLALRLRLSGAEAGLLETMARHAPALALTPSRHAARRALYRAGGVYADVCLLAWASAGAPPEDAVWIGLLRVPETDPIPPFPLKGADLVAQGVPKGPEIGRLLAVTEQAWIESDFGAGRAELLATLNRAGSA